MSKLTTTAEIGAFLASQTKTEARETIGFETGPITVADVSARKDTNSYTNGGPQPGATQVVQEDLPGIVWTLIGEDATDDNSWIGQPYTLDPNGQIIINLEIADVSGTIPDAGVLGRRGGNKLTLGDGVTEGGLKVDDGYPFYPTLLINDDATVEAYMLDEIPDLWMADDERDGLRIGDNVTSIGSNAFAFWGGNNQPLVIPDSVTSIGSYAFYSWFSNNQPLVIGDNVTSIEDHAFRDWGSNNQPLVIPDSVTSIGDFAFNYWTLNNQPLVIGDNVTSIGESAFGSWTSNDQPLVIGDSVVSIGSSAFSYWTANNQPLVIPDSVTSIGSSAFYYWTANNQPLVIPDSVTSIGSSAFPGWSANNQPLVIPDSVTDIGSVAFGYWSSNNQPLHIACPASAFSGTDIFKGKGTTPAIYVLADKGFTLGVQNFQGLTNVDIQLWTSYPDLMP